MRAGRGLLHTAAAAALAMGAALATAADRPLPPAPAPDPVATLHLVKTFDDEFDGTSLDKHRWTMGDPHAAVPQRTLSGNGEREIYVDPAYLDLGIQPVTLHGGQMTITARPLTPAERVVVGGAAAASPGYTRGSPLDALAYASGRITTRRGFSQRYGYFEARLRFSPGRGLWPAFWLLPADDTWPPEIDVMEALGHEPDKVYGTVHMAGPVPQIGFPAPLSPSTDGFHRYGVLWGPETIDFFVDGVKTGSAKTPEAAHKPMYMILNLAVGGYWPGYPDAATRFPATLDVDYVRAWRFPAGAARPPAG